jgi:hydrogenase maturation protease
VHFIRWIGQRYAFDDSLRIVDGGTLGYRLLDTVCSSKRIIAVDVIKTRTSPDRCTASAGRSSSCAWPEPTSAHEVEYLDVLCQAEIMGELPEVTFLCVVPERYGDMSLHMTGRMAHAFPAVEELLLQELGGWASPGGGLRMHEMSLVSSMLDIVDEYAARHAFRQVNVLRLSFGALSAIDGSRSAWPLTCSLRTGPHRARGSNALSTPLSSTASAAARIRRG